MAMAQYDCLKRRGVDGQPVEIPDQSVRRDACIEEDAPPAVADLQLDQSREAVFCPQEVDTFPAFRERRGNHRNLTGRSQRTPASDQTFVGHEDVRRVVDDGRDRDGVDRLEWNLLHHTRLTSPRPAGPDQPSWGIGGHQHCRGQGAPGVERNGTNE